MAFTIADFEDLVRLLGEHPEWRAQLRPLILGEEVLQVPSRMDRVEAAIGELSHGIDRLTAAIHALVQRQDRAEGELGNIRGELLESRFERNLGNWLRQWVRKPRKVQVDDLDLLEVAVAGGAITEEEVNQVAALDLLIQAQDRATTHDVLLAIEVSQTVDADDVERATARAAVLRRAGYEARGMVTGHRIGDRAEELAAELGTVVALIRPAA